MCPIMKVIILASICKDNMSINVRGSMTYVDMDKAILLSTYESSSCSEFAIAI